MSKCWTGSEPFPLCEEEPKEPKSIITKQNDMIESKEGEIQFEYTYKGVPYLVDMNVTAKEHIIVTSGDWDTPDDHEHDFFEIEIHSSVVLYAETDELVYDELEHLIINSILTKDIWDKL